MFIGYSDFQTQKLKCDVVPVKNRKSQTYVAFRISDTDGIVSADNMSGKPYLLEIVPQPIGEASGRVPKQSRMWPSTGFRPSAQSVFPMA